jgi:NADH-quinone oxidoreductase subunit E
MYLLFYLTIKRGLEGISAMKTQRENLIPVLQEVQEKEGYLSRESIMKISEELDIPPSKIYGVASFYNQFRFQPTGKYEIQICRGTACHVQGSGKLQEILESELGIKHGETTPDGLFSLKVVACMGACGLAPVICVNGEFFAKVNAEKIRSILKEFREKEQK